MTSVLKHGGGGGDIDLLLFQIENSGSHVKGVLEGDEPGVETSGRSFQLRREKERERP